MARVVIPVEQLEYEEDGDTLWIHSPQGATVLRIKLLQGKFRSRPDDCENVCSHLDMLILDISSDAKDVHFCLIKKDQP